MTTERDKIIHEVLAAYEAGFVFVRRPDHTVEIWPEEVKIDGETIEQCSSSSDDDGHMLAWFLSMCDEPPQHIRRKP